MKLYIRNKLLGLHGGPVDKNPLSSVEHSDLIPCSGTKIPHEAKHISLQL